MQHFGISGSGASKRRHYSTIIVLDEIDMLMTRDQAVRREESELQQSHSRPSPLLISLRIQSMADCSADSCTTLC